MANTITAVATVALVLVTAWYVCLTKKLVESASPLPWLEPTMLMQGLSVQGVQLTNRGLGHAIYISASMSVKRITKKSAGMATGFEEQAPLSGPEILLPGKHAQYQVKDSYLMATTTFVVSCRNLTGRRITFEWEWQQSRQSEDQWRLLGLKTK